MSGEYSDDIVDAQEAEEVAQEKAEGDAEDSYADDAEELDGEEETEATAGQEKSPMEAVSKAQESQPSSKGNPAAKPQPKQTSKPNPLASKPKQQARQPTSTKATTAAPTRSAGPRRSTAPNQNGRFTFSAAPSCIRAHRNVRSDYSHNKYEEWKIQRDNEKLCERLMHIQLHADPAIARAQPTGGAGAHVPSYVSASAINRKKQEGEIVAANLAMFKRLQAVKPSKDLGRNALAAAFAQSQQYKANLLKRKDGAQTSKPAASNSSNRVVGEEASTVSAPSRAHPSALFPHKSDLSKKERSMSGKQAQEQEDAELALEKTGMSSTYAADEFEEDQELQTKEEEPEAGKDGDHYSDDIAIEPEAVAA